MRIGVDLDGVVYPFEIQFGRYLVDYVGFDEARCAVPVHSYGFYEEWGLTKDEFLDHCHEAVDLGVLFGVGDPYPGTRAALQRLVDAGHTLHVVTARGGMGTPGRAEGNTQFWLEHHLPLFESVTFSNDKTIVRADAFIEDRTNNYDALHFNGVRATLINRPWNVQEQEWPWRRRVNTMDEFADDILTIGVTGRRAA